MILNAGGRVVGMAAAPDGDFAVDDDGTLYDTPIFPDGGSNRIWVLAPPYHVSKIIRFDDRLGSPHFSVAVDPRQGLFAIGGYYYQVGGGAVNYAYFYRRGATKPCATLGHADIALRYGAAFDREGQLFFGASFSSEPGVAIIPGGCKATNLIAAVFPKNPMFYLQNHLQFNADDDLVVGDVLSGHILTYKHPVNGFFGQPIRTTILKTRLPERDVPYFLCLTGDGSHLWANYGPNAIAEYRYPAGGLPVKVVAVSNAYEGATFPPLVP